MKIRFNLEGVFLESHVLTLTGWCFSPTSKTPLCLHVQDGDQSIGSFLCDQPRPDVHAVFTRKKIFNSSLPLCGFEQKIEIPFATSSIELMEMTSGKIIKKIALDRLKREQAVWMVSGGEAGGRLRALRQIYGKARRVVRWDNVLSPRSWRLWMVYAREEFRLRGSQATSSTVASPSAISPVVAFVEKNKIRPHVRSLLARSLPVFSYQPTISLLMPVYNVAPQLLHEAISSVKEQIYPNWELCIADDASTSPGTIEALSRYEGEERIRIVRRAENGHICRATNDAADMATGEFIALIDNDDLLAPHALFEIVRLLQQHPDADLIYTDEDKMDMEGRHYDLHFKPDWSPALLLGYNYINHLTCMRRTLFEDVGRFRPGYEGAQDYDLLLRVTERTDRVFHIPKILYHWRAVPGSTALQSTEKSIVSTSAETILGEALERRQLPATAYRPVFAQELKVPVHQLDWPDEGPLVEIVIPTFNQAKILKVCLDSIRRLTTYRNYRIMVVDNGSDSPDALSYFAKLQMESGVRVERIPNDSKGFSFSRINNLAVERSEAELLLFLNNDTEVIEPKWLSRMVGYLSLTGIGAVGARLLYPNGRIQHAGVVLGMGGGFIPDHAFCRLPKEMPGYFFLPGTAHEVSAVTGACLLTRREDFLRIGGFDQNDFSISLNDVDLCLKLAREGLRTLYVPGAELIHHESLSRIPDDDPAELATFRRKYKGISDPFYGPNLSRESSYAIRPECTLDYGDFLKRPLKVVFFSHNLNMEGAPNILMAVARGVKASGRITPVIVAPCDGPARKILEAEGITVKIVKLRDEENILLAWLSLRELEKAVDTCVAFLAAEKPDVVVTNVLNTFFMVEAAHRLSLPSIWWLHESYDQALMLRNLHYAAMPMCEGAFAKATQVLFVSKDTASIYSRYNTNLNFSVIHNSLSAESINVVADDEARKGARKELGVKENQNVLISVGTVCDRKDQGTIVEAVRLLAQERDDCICYLVGYRDSLAYAADLADRIEKMNLGQKVILVPETRDVAKYYLAADIFLFSSLNESYSLTILEAMAFGLPIITTKCYGISEQVRFGKNALRFNFRDTKGLADNIRTLMDDVQMRKQFGRNSREVLRYLQSHAEMLDRHEELILGAYMRGGGGSIATLSTANPL